MTARQILTRAALAAVALAYLATGCALEVNAPPPPAPIMGEQ